MCRLFFCCLTKCHWNDFWKMPLYALLKIFFIRVAGVCSPLNIRGHMFGLSKKITVAFSMSFLAASAAASTVNVDVTEEHQVIRGFGGMVHNEWQSGGGLSEADAKIAFGTGEGTIGLNTLRIPVYANSNSFNKEVNAAKYAKKYAGDDFTLKT